MLVIMEDRDIHDLLELLLDVEAFGTLDVFQVDAAKRRFEEFDGTNDFVRILGVELNVENIDVGKALEQNAFAFHDRFAGQRADIPQPQNRRAIGDDRHQIPFGCILVGVVRVLFDFQARLGYPRAIGEGEIAAGGAGFGGDDFDFAFAA